MIKLLLLLILLGIGYPILAAPEKTDNPDICDEACLAAKSEPVGDNELETGWPGCSENQTPVTTLNEKTALNKTAVPDPYGSQDPSTTRGTE